MDFVWIQSVGHDEDNYILIILNPLIYTHTIFLNLLRPYLISFINVYLFSGAVRIVKKFKTSSQNIENGEKQTKFIF